MTQTINVDIWEDIYKECKAGSFLQYPSENLIRFFYSIKSNLKDNAKCLDYGFGSGNNAEFLITRVPELFGLEVSQSSCDITKKRLKLYDQFKENNFLVSKDAALSFASSTFDLIVAWQVLYYNGHQDLVKSIATLHDCLKKDGIIIATLPTQRDTCFKDATLVEGNTYRVNSVLPQQEGCIVTVPENEEVFLDYYKSFELINSGYFETMSSSQTKPAASHYYFIGRK